MTKSSYECIYNCVEKAFKDIENKQRTDPYIYINDKLVYIDDELNEFTAVIPDDNYDKVILSVNDQIYATLYLHEEMGHNTYVIHTELYDEEDLFFLCRTVESLSGQRALYEPFPYSKANSREQNYRDMEDRLTETACEVRDNIFAQTGAILNIFPNANRAFLIDEGYTDTSAYGYSPRCPEKTFRCYRVHGDTLDYFDYGLKRDENGDVSFTIHGNPIFVIRESFMDSWYSSKDIKPLVVSVTKEELENAPYQSLGSVLCKYARHEKDIKKNKDIER